MLGLKLPKLMCVILLSQEVAGGVAESCINPSSANLNNLIFYPQVGKNYLHNYVQFELKYNFMRI